jgi:hypothetical protein
LIATKKWLVNEFIIIESQMTNHLAIFDWKNKWGHLTTLYRRNIRSLKDWVYYTIIMKKFGDRKVCCAITMVLFLWTKGKRVILSVFCLLWLFMHHPVTNININWIYLKSGFLFILVTGWCTLFWQFDDDVRKLLYRTFQLFKCNISLKNP